MIVAVWMNTFVQFEGFYFEPCQQWIIVIKKLIQKGQNEMALNSEKYTKIFNWTRIL